MTAESLTSQTFTLQSEWIHTLFCHIAIHYKSNFEHYEVLALFWYKAINIIEIKYAEMMVLLKEGCQVRLLEPNMVTQLFWCTQE